MSLPAVWADTSHAQLPATYEAAKTALSECVILDECKNWADRAAALASYARQADDIELEKLAVRIRARAVRRCGELLAETEPNLGGRPPKNTCAPSQEFTSGRTQAARDAGLSHHRQAQALRLAAVPAHEFEAEIESATPTSINELAKRGTVKRTPVLDIGDRNPDDFKAATFALGGLRTFVADAVSLNPQAIARGLSGHEIRTVSGLARKTIEWCERLQQCLENEGR